MKLFLYVSLGGSTGVRRCLGYHDRRVALGTPLDSRMPRYCGPCRPLWALMPSRSLGADRARRCCPSRAYRAPRSAVSPTPASSACSSPPRSLHITRTHTTPCPQFLSPPPAHACEYCVLQSAQVCAYSLLLLSIFPESLHFVFQSAQEI